MEIGTAVLRTSSLLSAHNFGGALLGALHLSTALVVSFLLYVGAGPVSACGRRWSLGLGLGRDCT